MKILLNNVDCETIIGGKDNLLPFNLSKEIDSYFSVAYKNSFWMNKKTDSDSKNKKRWDGKKHFFKNDKFPTGFLPMLLTFLDDNEVSYTIEDVRSNIPRLRSNFIDTFTAKDGTEWKLRDYQAPLVLKALSNTITNNHHYFPRGIIDAATNAGKNIMIVGLNENYVNPKALFLIHSSDIYEQAVEYFSQFYDVGEINSKKYRVTDFTIAMVKSLHNKAADSFNVLQDLQNFNIVYSDECDHAGSKQYQAILKRVGAGARFFVSGTPLDSVEKLTNLNIIAMSGPKLGKITNRELIDKGVSREPIVNIHYVNTPTKVKPITYEEEEEAYIFTSEVLAAQVKKIIEEHKENSILVAFIEEKHGRLLFDRINDLGLTTEFMYHGTKQRKSIFQRFKDKITQILVSSTVSSTGLNLPNIQVLIMVTGGMNKRLVKQFVGRAVRWNGEDTVLVFDFYIEGKHMSRHSRFRIRVYKKEGFKVIEHYKTKRGIYAGN